MPRRIPQNMAVAQKSVPHYVTVYPSGAWTWTCPRSGRYRFVQWGAGGHGNDGTNTGGSSGAHAQTVRYMTKGQTVTINVAGPSAGGQDDTTLTFPNGTVVTTTSGADGGGAVGTSTGGDINLSGSLGGGASTDGAAGLGDAGGLGGPADGTNGGGAGAPGSGEFRGGRGGGYDNVVVGQVNDGAAPGGGGGATAAAGGGDGLVIIVREQPADR